jgi:hypothetical protein
MGGGVLVGGVVPAESDDVLPRGEAYSFAGAAFEDEDLVLLVPEDDSDVV